MSIRPSIENITDFLYFTYGPETSLQGRYTLYPVWKFGQAVRCFSELVGILTSQGVS